MINLFEVVYTNPSIVQLLMHHELQFLTRDALSIRVTMCCVLSAMCYQPLLTNWLLQCSHVHSTMVGNLTTQIEEVTIAASCVQPNKGCFALGEQKGLCAANQIRWQSSPSHVENAFTKNQKPRQKWPKACSRWAKSHEVCLKGAQNRPRLPKHALDVLL
jgi:hypothetical protein